jgi:hypothetical protein
MGTGGGSQSSKTTSEPWKEQAPYLKQGFQEAQNLYNQGPADYFPGQTFTDMSPQTQAGLLGVEQTATDGNPIIGNAANYTASTLGGNSDNPYASLLTTGADQLRATANGDFLTNNPTLDATYNAAAGRLTDSFNNSVTPAIAAQFGLSGGTGGGLHGLALSDAGGQLGNSLADLSANIYGGAYENERNRQTSAASNLASLGGSLYGTGVNERLQALGLSPTIREAQYGDSSHLLEAGKSYEDQANKELQDQINRFNYNENAPLASLQDYLALISGNFGGTSATRGTTSSSGSGLSTALGGVATLASLFA